MSEYSPLAGELLTEWNRMSMNMRSAIFRAKYLQEKAERSGTLERLKAPSALKTETAALLSSLTLPFAPEEASLVPRLLESDPEHLRLQIHFHRTLECF